MGGILRKYASSRNSSSAPSSTRPCARKRTVAVAREPRPLGHEVVDRRVGGARVEGKERTRRLGCGGARIDPGQVADAAEVEKAQRALRPDPPCAGEVVERRERRALAAQSHVGRAEVPDHRQSQSLGQRCAIAQLVRAAAFRVMGQGLAVEADHLGTLEPRQHLEMGVLDHARRLGAVVFLPTPQCGLEHAPLGLGIGAVGGGPKSRMRAPSVSTMAASTPSSEVPDIAPKAQTGPSDLLPNLRFTFAPLPAMALPASIPR